jgi:hypothetical protein
MYSFATNMVQIKNLPTTETEWSAEQDKDKKLAILKQLVSDNKTAKFKVKANNLLVTDKDQIMVPQHLRKLALEICHDSILGGHYGTKKTGQKLEENFCWHGMKTDAAIWVKSCEICQRIKPKNRKKVGFFASRPESAVGKEVSLDLFGPLPRSSKGNRFALVMVDNFSKWVEIYPLRTITSPVILDRVLSYLFRNGFPEKLKSDNASQFRGRLWKQILGYLGVTQKFQSPFRPQSNLTDTKTGIAIWKLLRSVCVGR